MNHLQRKNISTRIVACSLVFSVMASPIVGTGIVKAAPVNAPASSAHQAKEQATTNSPIRYQIDARLDEKTMTLHGSETVIYKNTSKDSLRELVFHTFADANRSESTQAQMFASANAQIRKDNPDKQAADFLGGIDILQVKETGKQLVFENKQQVLTVKLDRELKPGETVTAQVDFKVKIPYGSHRLSYYQNIINGAHWFPVMSVYDGSKHQWDRTPYSTSFESDYYTVSDYEVQLNVPASYQVSMPGMITVKDAEAGRKTVATTANRTREFVFFASPDYKVERDTRDGLTVEYYYFDNGPGKEKVIEAYIDQAFKAIGFFNDKYGEYPYPEFRIVESHVEGLAVEFSRLIQMGMIKGNPDVEGHTAFVHEIAHQWFHSLIGNNSETESFLDEGFADFSTVYFSEKQGDVMNGFKSIQLDEGAFDTAISASNTEVGDLWQPVYYHKGRQAIYQLYRTVGEEKFDLFMKAYFNRFVYQNATIDGLLETIGETLGKEAQSEIEQALRQPNFELKPEYQLTDAERAEYMHEMMKSMYHGVLAQNPDLPFETISRIMDKTLQGEPLTVVLSESASKKAKAQQQAVLKSLQTTFDIFGIQQPTVLSERQVIKKKLKNELANSNVIVIGSAATNPLVQALKPGIIKRADDIGFKWKATMSKPNTAGAYIIKHPHNQKRLLLHFFWTGDQLSTASAEDYNAMISKSMSFSSAFYQFYLMDQTGKLVMEKKNDNAISELFE